MKRIEPMSIRQIIDRVIDTSSSRDEFLEHRAAALWAETVGPGINRHTLRRYVSKGVLHVYISSGPVKSELEYSKTRIIAAINATLGSEVLKALAIH